MYEIMVRLRATFNLATFKLACAELVKQYGVHYARAQSSDYKVRRSGRNEVNRLSVWVAELKAHSYSIDGATSAMEGMRGKLSMIEEEKADKLSAF